MMRKRILSFLLAVATVLNCGVISVFAEDPTVPDNMVPIGDSESGELCICTVLCTEDSVNPDCPVCSSAGVDNCLGEETKETNESAKCICNTFCTLESVNSECLICRDNIDECRGEGQKDLCSCTALCDEESINEKCAICVENIVACKGPTEVLPDEKTSCTCDIPCTEENINFGCPVCGVDGADLTACLGKSEDDVTVESWCFVENSDGLAVTEENGGYYVQPQSVENGIPLEDLTTLLPQAIEAQVAPAGAPEVLDSGMQTVTIGISGWECENYISTTKTAEDGTETILWPTVGEYTFTAALGEGYAFDAAPQIIVRIGAVNLLATDVAEGIWDGSVATSFAGGSGTKNDPYLISNGAELAYLSYLTRNSAGSSNGRYYILTQDIYLNDTSNFEDWGSIPPANSWTPIGFLEDRDYYSYRFEGNFDGNGHAIYGVYIALDNSESVGLFGMCDGATVSNLSVVDSFISGKQYIGGITGSSKNESLFYNCYSNCLIQGERLIGGISGSDDSGVFRYCRNEGDVTATIDSAGGIVGSSRGEAANYTTGTIEYCYNTGNITGASGVGGIAGCASYFTNCYNAGIITVTDRTAGGITGTLTAIAKDGYNHVVNCYNAGEIRCSNESLNLEDKKIGALIGNREVMTTLESSYFLDTTAEYDFGIGGWYTARKDCALTDEQMRSSENFAGFDFISTWYIDNDKDSEYKYPQLAFPDETRRYAVLSVVDSETSEPIDGFTVNLDSSSGLTYVEVDGVHYIVGSGNAFSSNVCFEIIKEGYETCQCLSSDLISSISIQDTSVNIIALKKSLISISLNQEKLNGPTIEAPDQRYEYIIKATVRNGMDIVAKDVIANFIPKTLLTVSQDTPATIKLGDIQPEETKNVQWTVYADVPQESTIAEFDIVITVDNGQIKLLKSDYIYLDTGIVPTDLDRWNFSNGNAYFGPEDETYYILPLDYDILVSGLSNIERVLIEKQKEKTWGGSCYGISVTALLVNIGILDPKDIPNGRSSLFDIPKTNNDAVESFINFYHLQQFLDPPRLDKNKFSLLNTKEQLSIIEETAREEKPFILSIACEQGGHAVVGHGLEQGNYSVNGKTYDYRVSIYDCNAPDEIAYLYFNSEKSQWQLKTGGFNFTKLMRAQTSPDILACKDYTTSVQNYFAYLLLERDTAAYLEYQGKKYLIDGNTDERQIGIVSYYDENAYVDENGNLAFSGDLNCTLPDLTAEYKLTPADDKPFNYTLTYENAAITAAAADAQSVRFEPDGLLEVEEGIGNYSYTLCFNDGYHTLPWYQFTIEGNNSGNMLLEQTEDGVHIQSPNLNGAVITVEDEETEQTLTVATQKNEILVSYKTVKNKKIPVILVDTDGDGNFDSEESNVGTQFKVELHTNGGIIHSGNLTDYIYGIGAQLPTNITKEGYTFAGWYESPNLNGQPVAEITKTDTGDKSYYAKWLSADTKVDVISINNTVGAINGTTISVVLPHGSTIPTDKNAISITVAAGATIGDTLSTNDGGKMWTFTVTAEDGVTKQNYTITVSIAPDSATENKADVEAAKSVLENHNWTVTQATANTSDTVKGWIENQIKSLNLNNVNYTVTITDFTAAIAGTLSDKDGTNGRVTFTVSLSKGEDETRVEDSVTLTGVIIATLYTDGSSGNSGKPSSGNHSGGGSSGSSNSSYRDREQDFWNRVEDRLEDAEPGDTVKANAKDVDRIPQSVMDTLRATEGVILHITWNGGEDIVIPSEAALNEANRIFYSLSYLEGLDFTVPADQTGAVQTDGTTVEVEAPVSNPAGWEPTAPEQGQTEEQEQTESEPDEFTSQPESEPNSEPETKPEIQSDEETMARPESDGLPLGWILGSAAVVIAVGLGFWFWKRRTQK